MEYSQRSRSNAVCFTDFQRNIYMNDDSYDKDLYQFERELSNNNNPLQGPSYNPFYKKQNQFNLLAEENPLSSYCYLNEGLDVELQQNPHSKQCLETSQHLSIDNLRSAEDLKSITDGFLKNLNVQENKSIINDPQIPTSKFIHH